MSECFNGKPSDTKPSDNALHKRSIIKKTLQVGGSTLLSRVLAIAREILLLRFLGGAGGISDVFLMAYRIPNSFRKIFAEGALSAATVPTLVKSIKSSGKDSVSSLMTLLFLVFEGAVLALCAFVIWKAQWVMSVVAPGFSPEQVVLAVRWLRIFMPFILFLSSSALLAGALQSLNRFFVPAISPALLNVVWIISLIACFTFDFPVETLCYFILFGGFLQFIFHLIAYFRLHFSFHKIDNEAWLSFGRVMMKFLPCLLSMSIVEVSLFVDSYFASYLQPGSISLIYLANRFMGIPLGVFATAFSTILLPHFSRISIYAPKRMSFYLLEATKFVFWIAVPVAFMMIYFSENIIYSFLFYTKKFSLVQVGEASSILIAFLMGLFFFSLNKILLNVYYSFHNTWLPTIIAIFSTVINFLLNRLLVQIFMATGIALATTISAVIQTILFLTFLHLFFKLRFYFFRFLEFFVRYMLQLVCAFTFMILVCKIIIKIIPYFPELLSKFFLGPIGYWFWIGPIIIFTVAIIVHTRRFFKIKLHFMD